MVFSIESVITTCVSWIMKFGTLLVAILFLALTGVSVVDVTLAEWMALILIIVAGIPHGSFDLRVAQTKWGTHGAKRWLLITAYLILVILMSGFCLVQPLLGFLSFLAISALHFSEGESLDSRSTYSVRGCCVGVGAIIIPIGMHLDEARNYLAFFVSEPMFVALSPWILATAWGLSGFILLGEIITLVRGPQVNRAESIERLLCLVAWMSLSPLAGFAVWFLGRHSRMHLETCGAMFSETRFTIPLDFLLLSVAAVVLLLPFAWLFDLTDIHQLFTATLALVAGLTLPHIVVSHRMQDTV